MTNLVTIKTDNLPAHVKAKLGTNKAFMAGAGGAAYPFLSIKGKNWTVVRSDGKKLVTRPDDPDSAASYVDVVLIAANEHKSKVFYANGYTEGSNEKPTCASDNGVSPNADVAEPQAKKCATCPQNVWGGGPGGKGRACRDSKRVAVAPIGTINDPMLLRVPPTSLNALSEYVKAFDDRGLDVTAAITRMKFDPEEASPKLIFKHQGWLDEEQCEEVARQAETDTVKQIIGVMATPHAGTAKPAADEDDEPVKPKKPAKPAVTEDDLDDALEGKPVKAAAKAAPAKVEDDDEDEKPAPKKAAPKKESKAVVSESLDAALEALDDL